MDKSRNYYVAPATEVVEIQFEAIMILASQEGYGDAIELF